MRRMNALKFCLWVVFSGQSGVSTSYIKTRDRRRVRQSAFIVSVCFLAGTCRIDRLGFYFSLCFTVMLAILVSDDLHPLFLFVRSTNELYTCLVILCNLFLGADQAFSFKLIPLS